MPRCASRGLGKERRPLSIESGREEPHAAPTPRADGYERRRPEDTLLHRVVREHWPVFRERAEEHGGLPRFVTRELDDYLNFLKGGCSKDPLDLLRGAGVDMEKPDRVDNALEQFGRMVNELDGLI